jgi:uncharacterized membrane protein YphA (DoxX/SURF4 family)
VSVKILPQLVEAAGMVVGIVLLVAGLRKLRIRRTTFADVVKSLQVLPESLVPLAAHVIPWLELVTGLGLVFSNTRPVASLLAMMLLTGFTVSIALNLLRGRQDLQCGCFGTSSREI